MTKMDHWLHGEDKRKHQIDKESDCSKCIHVEVCRSLRGFKGFMEKLCLNNLFSDSRYSGCQSCSHSYTRYDNKQPIPCFLCKHFEEGGIQDAV